MKLNQYEIGKDLGQNEKEKKRKKKNDNVEPSQQFLNLKRMSSNNETKSL